MKDLHTLFIEIHLWFVGFDKVCRVTNPRSPVEDHTSQERRRDLGFAEKNLISN